MGTKNNAYRVLVGRSEGKRPLGIPKSKCEDNIKLNFKAIKYNIVDWIYISQGSEKWQVVVRRVMNLWVT